MKYPFKEFFYFSRGERRGILLLLAMIVLVLLFGMFKEEPPETGAGTEVNKGNYINKERAHYTRRYAREYFNDSISRAVGNPAAELFPFNPNTADSSTFIRLGLPPFLARNILKYREAGGKFRRPEEFRKLYGLWEEQYQRLLPFIVIPEEEQERMRPQTYEVKEIPRLYLPAARMDSMALASGMSDSTYTDSLCRKRVYKYPAGTIVDLNRADTTELKKIPGVGTAISRMIVVYRERLGGYYRIEQLAEIQLDHEQLRPWLQIDTTALRKIPVNRAGIQRLMSHPYLNFYQAKVLVEYRRKEGEIKSLKPFVLYEEFTQKDLERIGHYLDFKQ